MTTQFLAPSFSTTLTKAPASEQGRHARSGLVRFLLIMATVTVALLLGSESASAQPADMASPAVQSVNINSDSATALADGLTGVGLARAEDIIRYREEFGPFTTVEQLSEVKGIGTATLDKNRARIKLD